MIKLKVELKKLNEEELTKLVLATNRLERDVPFDVYFSDKKKVRSLAQNKYMWSVVYKAFSDLWGYEKEVVHEICKAKFLLRTTYDIEGEMIEAGLSTKVISTKEMMLYIESMRLWAREKFGLYIPNPNELTDAEIVEAMNDTH